MCVCVCGQMVCKLVRGEQKVGELEGKLPSLLLSSGQDDYWRLAQKVTSTVEAWREVGYIWNTPMTHYWETHGYVVPSNKIWFSTQAEEKSLTLRNQLDHYATERSHLISLAETASLTLDLLHQCSPHHTPIVSLNLFQRHLASALRDSDEPDGGEREMLGSLTTALQATAGVLSAAEAERAEREGRWKDGVLQELMVAAVRDMAWSAFMFQYS